MLTQDDFFRNKTVEDFLRSVKSKIEPERYQHIIATRQYEKELLKLQAELVDLQQWVAKTKKTCLCNF